MSSLPHFLGSSSPCSSHTPSRTASKESTYTPNTHGKLFNIAHLRTKTKGTEKLIRELFFADDVALTSHGRRLAAASQSPCTCVQGARADHQPTKDQCNGIRHRLSPKYRHRRGHNLESMDSFTYLKSSISNSISIATKIKAGSAGPGEENAPRPHP